MAAVMTLRGFQSPPVALGRPASLRPTTRRRSRQTTRRASAATFWRRRVVTIVLATGIVVAAGQAASALGGVPLAASGRGPSVTSYVVEPGDTLWSVAELLAPGADPRPVVDALAEARGSTEVVLGETITWVEGSE